MTNIFDRQQISMDIWRDKYRHGNEKDPYQSIARVVAGIYGNLGDHNKVPARNAIEAMTLGRWLPGGRILAGAGTDRHVTLMNCYVAPKMEDSSEGIWSTFTDAMMTLRQGGGIGTDFTPLRPKGAKLKRLGGGAVSSGPVSFMDVWHSGCSTIMSAGYRRGAMMGTLGIWHPDIEEFIDAKHEKGRLTNFNVSVLVNDAFMEAVKYNDTWILWHSAEPQGPHQGFVERNGIKYYIYKTVKARDLWDKLLKSTYEYSEPGVIFIDQVNKRNNLRHVEDIQCTNPCGEQPLPHNGACCLGQINLAALVVEPFTNAAHIDLLALRDTVGIAVDFLDRVIDVTNYPLEAQKQEMMQKRRIGLGITGLADAMVMCGIRYGSRESVIFTRDIMHAIATKAYKTSIELAKSKGPFPLWEEARVWETRLFNELFGPTSLEHEDIKRTGIRNGVLLTIAPVGTGSIYYGNVSSGLEPIFAYSINRKVLQPDGSRREYVAYDYAYDLYHQVFKARHGSVEMPSHWVTAKDLTVEDHLAVMAACQEYVDASISKTINCPSDISFEDFKQVYVSAYEKGCKGCTTYRPSEVRGSVLTDAADKPASPTTDNITAGASLPQPPKDAVSQGNLTTPKLPGRPVVLTGKTYKVKWPSLDAALYVTINDAGGKPYEMFIASRSAAHNEWTTALTRMVSAIFRMAKNANFIFEELGQVASAHDSCWVDGRHYPSLPAYLGYILSCHYNGIDPSSKEQKPSDNAPLGAQGEKLVEVSTPDGRMPSCPKCLSRNVRREEGCTKCEDCGHSNCG